MKKHKGWYALTNVLLLLWICCAASGCQSSQQYRDEVKDLSSAFLVPMDTRYLHDEKGSRPLDGRARSLTVRQASILAAENDEKILAMLAELRKAKIDVKDALTHVWPRFDLHTQADIPVNADTDQDNQLTGGVYIKYDIWKAIAVPDEHALRQALVNKELNQLKIALNGLLKNILHQLTQIDFLQYKIGRRSQSLTKAKNAYRIVQAYAEQNEVSDAVVQSWKSRIDALTLDLRKARQELRAIRHSFAHMMGFDTRQDIDITDMQTVLTSYESLSGTVPAPSKIWARHDEARLAEADYIAAAVNVKLKKMEGLPQVQTSLGFGKVPLTDTTDTAATLFQVSVNLPIWDLGDNERKVVKAEITRNLAKAHLKKEAVDLYDRAREAGSLLHAARRNYRELNASYVEMDKRLQDMSILMSENLLNPLEDTLAQLNVTDADIMRRDALARIRETGGDFEYSIGEDVIKGMIPVLMKDLLRQHQGTDQPPGLNQEALKTNTLDSHGK